MVSNPRVMLAVSMLLFGAGFVLGGVIQPWETAHAQSGDRVFELRTYTTPEGKLPNLEARFRDHTMRIFQKHGMSNVAYWTPTDTPASENTLIYVIAHPSREAAEAAWASFRDDPEWATVSRESQVDGRIEAGVESVFMEATDYSPIQ